MFFYCLTCMGILIKHQNLSHALGSGHRNDRKHLLSTCYVPDTIPSLFLRYFSIFRITCLDWSLYYPHFADNYTGWTVTHSGEGLAPSVACCTSQCLFSVGPLVRHFPALVFCKSGGLPQWLGSAQHDWWVYSFIWGWFPWDPVLAL